MKKLFFVLTLALTLFACGDNDEPKNKPEEPKSEMTVLCYLLADATSLEDDLWANVAAIYDGLAMMDRPATVLIYWDGTESYSLWNHPVVLKYTTDGKGKINGKPQLPNDSYIEDVVEVAEIVKEYPQQLSTDKAVMSAVLNDLVGMTDTQQIGLVAGSHGSAWLNSIFFSRSMARSFGQDGKGSDNTITIKDMAEAMRSTGRKFDFLLFDACNMGTIEVCYDLKDATDYLIASVMEIPSYGFPYESSLKYLYEGTPEGYKKICDAYINYYDADTSDGGEHGWGTIALIDNRQIDALTTLFNREIVEHKEMLADYTPFHLQEYGCNNRTEYVACDLEQFLKDINGGTLPADVQTQLSKTILHKNIVDEVHYFCGQYQADVTNYCGLGVYIPISSRTHWNDTFKKLTWYPVSGWNEVSFSWGF